MMMTRKEKGETTTRRDESDPPLPALLAAGKLRQTGKKQNHKAKATPEVSAGLGIAPPAFALPADNAQEDAMLRLLRQLPTEWQRR